MILAGRGPIAPPFAIGHECVARVVDVGDAVSHVAPGDLVVVPWAISCGECSSCGSRIARDNVHAHLPAALELARSGRVEPRRVVSDVIDWEDLPAALAERHLKPVFTREVPDAT